MNKKDAINLLGGTPSAAAKAIGISPQAVNDWPEVLSARIADRVELAHIRLLKNAQSDTKDSDLKQSCKV